MKYRLSNIIKPENYHESKREKKYNKRLEAGGQDHFI